MRTEDTAKLRRELKAYQEQVRLEREQAQAQWRWAIERVRKWEEMKSE